MEVFGGVQLPSFTELHHDVEIARIIENFIDLDDVGMFKLNR